MPTVNLAIPFDHPGSRDVRLLQEAARLGPVHALLWSDQAIRTLAGREPGLPEAERKYFLQAIRHVAQVTVVEAPETAGALPAVPGPAPGLWVAHGPDDFAGIQVACATLGVPCRMMRDAELSGFPLDPLEPAVKGRRKVLVTGSYDWLHSGHVRCFEEVSGLGDVYVVVGHDLAIRLLKGAGHPQFTAIERRFLVAAVRYVKRALISTGNSWLDAEPEIQAIRPEVYAVTEDGDKREKREYCRRHGIEYLVLRRVPRPGLSARSSTQLRGF